MSTWRKKNFVCSKFIFASYKLKVYEIKIFYEFYIRDRRPENIKLQFNFKSFFKS